MSRVLITESLDPEAVDRLRAEHDVVFTTPDTLADALRNADAMIVRTYTRVDRALLDRTRHLRVVGRAGTGLDNIDVDACRSAGVEVVYAPEANTQAVVEYVLTIIADALRPRFPLRTALSDADWARARREQVASHQWTSRTIGILGAGRIGRRVAAVATAIGARVLAHDLLPLTAAQAGGASMVDLDTLLAQSHVLTIHVDGRPENRGFLGAERIARLRPDVIFVNTSRGFVVNRPALAAFLERNPAAHAYLDVHEPEPVPADDPLLHHAGATLYPHLASRTDEALRAMSSVVDDVAAVLAGRAPRFPAP